MGWSVSVASQSSRPLFHLMWEFGGTGIKRNKGERKRWKSAVWWELPLGRCVFSKGSTWGLISGPWRRQQLLPALGTLFRYYQAWRMSLDSFNLLLIISFGQQHPNEHMQFTVLRWHTHTHTLVHCTHACRLKSCSILSCSVYGPLPSHSSYTLVCVFN